MLPKHRSGLMRAGTTNLLPFLLLPACPRPTACCALASVTFCALLQGTRVATDFRLADAVTIAPLSDHVEYVCNKPGHLPLPTVAVVAARHQYLCSCVLCTRQGMLCPGGTIECCLKCGWWGGGGCSVGGGDGEVCVPWEC